MERDANSQINPGWIAKKENAVTTQKILIRDETKYDAAVITEVTITAFESMEISNHTEQFIIEALR